MSVAGTRHVSWLLNFLVMTLPRSSPSRSATLWDRSWCELPLKSTMLGISGDGERLRFDEEEGEENKKEGSMQRKRRGEKKKRRQVSACGVGEL